MKLQSLTALALVLASPPLVASTQQFDVVILNGRVLDPESGLDGVRNVGIRGDRIVAITADRISGRATIDARGLVVAPGFIDLHRHAHGDNSYRYQVLDGVTSALELEVGTADVDAWYRERAPGRLLNYGVAVGHIPVRMQLMGDSGVFLPSGPGGHKQATSEEVIELVRRIELGLSQGAAAVGMGLAYTPAASAMEALSVFRAAARHRASVPIHLRGGMSSLIEAMGDAAISGAPLHVVHVNSTGGRNTSYFLDAIREARSHGIDVTTEAYPYTAGASRIESALYDGWEQWPDERFQNFQWVVTGERLTRESFGKYRAEGGAVISHSNTEEMVSLAIADSLTMIASDGGRNLQDQPTHPRAAGTYARILGRYVREQNRLDLMTAIRKMTLMPARRLETRLPEMRDRGRIRVGALADIVMFDAAAVIDRATYENAALASEGIRYVLVNGTPVVRDGAVVDGVSPGRPLRAAVATSSR